VGVAINFRLGIWQLDRLEQRRAFNARVEAQVSQPVLRLEGAALSEDLTGMEYRQIVATGRYDFEHEVALRNHVWENQIGVHLLTPLKIEGSDGALAQTILVDRGWVPDSDFVYDGWEEYAEPGMVEVRGVIRASQDAPDFGRRADPTPVPGGEPLKAWYFANIGAISQQVPYPLLPVYIQQAPDAVHTGLPYRTQPVLELTEGPHLGYAIQWFTFGIILGLGYPLFISRQERRRAAGISTNTDA
jgi:surfeit locus 1 family protein